MDGSAYRCAGRDEEPVAVLVINRLALRRVSSDPSASIGVVRPLHYCCYERLCLDVLCGRGLDVSKSEELSGKKGGMCAWSVWDRVRSVINNWRRGHTF